MKNVKIVQFKSGIGQPERQKRTLAALGISRMHQVVIKEATPQVLGMLAKVQHLVRVEEID
jgi:large subunit ribosomal protein L30